MLTLLVLHLAAWAEEPPAAPEPAPTEVEPAAVEPAQPQPTAAEPTAPAPGPPKQPPPSGVQGELYVSTDTPGAQVVINGVPIGQLTPVMLQLPVGTHEIRALTTCGRASSTVEVRDGLIARATLKLESGPGALDVRTTPPGAAVLLDGEQVGVTPLLLEGLACGPHDLLVQGGEFADFRQKVEVPALDTAWVETTLVKQEQGTLLVAPTPLDALIWLDDEARGAGPMTIERVPVGMHALRVSAPGYKDETRQVSVEKDAVLRMDVALAESKGVSWVRVTANSGVTLASAGLAYAGLYNRKEGREAYDHHLSLTNANEAQRVYDEEVIPRFRLAKLELAGAAVLLAGAGALWVTTDFAVSAGPGGVMAHVRW